MGDVNSDAPREGRGVASASGAGGGAAGSLMADFHRHQPARPEPDGPQRAGHLWQASAPMWQSLAFVAFWSGRSWAPCAASRRPASAVVDHGLRSRALSKAAVLRAFEPHASSSQPRVLQKSGRSGLVTVVRRAAARAAALLA